MRTECFSPCFLSIPARTFAHRSNTLIVSSYMIVKLRTVRSVRICPMCPLRVLTMLGFHDSISILFDGNPRPRPRWTFAGWGRLSVGPSIRGPPSPVPALLMASLANLDPMVKAPATIPTSASTPCSGQASTTDDQTDSPLPSLLKAALYMARALL